MSNETVNEIIEEWKPVVIKHYGPEFEKAVSILYEASNKCLVRNTKTKLVLSHNKMNRYLLYGATIKKMIRGQRICLGSFYPDDIKKMNCVFIDGDNTNMVLSNLQWMTRSDTAKMTHERTKGTRKSKVEKAGKKVKIVSVTGTGDINLLNTVYDSMTTLSKKLDIRPSSICQSAKKGSLVNKQYKFEYVT